MTHTAVRRTTFTVLTLLFVIPWGVNLRAQAPDVSQVTAVVIQPVRKKLQQIVEQPAAIEPYETTPVFAKVSGYVQQIQVEMGDRVKGPEFDAQGQMAKPGQVLVRIAVPELIAALQQKRSALEQSRSQVEQAKAGVKVAEAKGISAAAGVTAAKASIRQADAQMAKTAAELARIKELNERNAVATKLVDEMRQNAAVAEAQRDEAAAQYESAQAAIGEAAALAAQARADLAATEAQVKVAEAAVLETQVQLEYATLYAPFTGVVTRRQAHTGHLIAAGASGEPLLVVARTDKVRVYLDVPETAASRVGVGNTVTLRFPATNLEPLTTKVTRIAWNLYQATRTLRAEVELPNAEGTYRPGSYAHAALVVGEKADAVTLPLTALTFGKNETTCLIVEQGKVAIRAVQIGLRTTTEAEIVEGLQGDEQVIRANTSIYTPGQIVRPVAFQAPKS